MGDEEKVEMTSHEVMKWLNDKERARYVAFQELFETTGWLLVKEYAEAKIAEFRQLGADAKTWEASRVALGARAAWEDVATMAEQFMNSFEQVAESNRLAAPDEGSPE